jgi:dihydroneopterin aldolase
MEVVIEIYGLEVYAYHGVLTEERERGQPFLFDVTLVAHDAGVRTDKLSDTVDYTEVAACVRDLATTSRFNLIEALAAATAEALLKRFDASRTRVRVRKPHVRLGGPVEFTAATVERSRR